MRKPLQPRTLQCSLLRSALSVLISILNTLPRVESVATVMVPFTVSSPSKTLVPLVALPSHKTLARTELQIPTTAASQRPRHRIFFAISCFMFFFGLLGSQAQGG